MGTNRPEPSDRYILDEDEQRIEYKKDEKLTNCGIFKVNKEDHTLGNIARTHLLRNKNVTFAGYRIPHPLYYYITVKIRTTGLLDPPAAFELALRSAHNELNNVEKNFRQALKEFKSRNPDAMGVDNYVDF
mmetsp:Transcript_20765/g.36968  ORF Transcript_20765/g.36968 Transcript_20765/m.36968 type:complete len:131 (+) Transcript_20765:39-431(+)